MQEIRVRAEVRGAAGTKRQLSTLRRLKIIPAVIYGGGKPPVSVTVTEASLVKATNAGGANAILHLEHARGEDTVLLKSLQRHVVTHQPIHADFQRISLKQKIEVKVPLRTVGEAPGAKLHGGILEHILREFKVRCLPTAIPTHVDVDVSRLEINQSLLVKDIPVPAGVEILDAPDHIVVNIVQPTAEAAPAAAEAGVGALEPEVITKGKKDAEEGAEAGGKAASGKEAGAKPTEPAAGEKQKEGAK